VALTDSPFGSPLRSEFVTAGKVRGVAVVVLAIRLPGSVGTS